MDLNAARDLAHSLMDKHGIAGTWAFAFDNARRRMGLCNYNARRLSISRHYTKAADEAQVQDTILHEIAHVIAGSRAYHGPQWKKVARELGATPKACGDNPFASSEGEVAKLLAKVEGQPFYRVTGSGKYSDRRYRILQENTKTYRLVDEEGDELRAAKGFVYLEGTKPPTAEESREAERQDNLARVKGKPVMRVNLAGYRENRYAIIRAARTARERHLLVNLDTGNTLRCPQAHVRPETPMQTLGQMLAS